MRASRLLSILLMQQLAALGWILFRVNHLSDLPVYLLMSSVPVSTASA